MTKSWLIAFLLIKQPTMNLFNSVSKPLQNALADLGYNEPTPIQNETFSIILSGRDLVGIAQTGTGKTLAYCLPILDQLKYSTQLHPRILILVPTRELVNQVVDWYTIHHHHFSNLQLMALH